MPKPRVRTLSPSQEDYLEAILRLTDETGTARAGDIADRMSVSRPSVTTALRSLAKRKLVNYEPYHLVTLTDEGRSLADRVSRRHRVLRTFLADVLGLDAATAEANACRMEHEIDRAVLDRLDRFVEYMTNESPRAKQVVRGFLEAL